MQLSF